MRLGKVKVQKKNVLSSAIHNIYGLVWTTGTSVLLTELSQLDNGTCASPTPGDCDLRKSAVTLGEFSVVEDVCWSDHDSKAPLLSAIHKETDEAQPTLEVWEFVQSKNRLELRSILKQHLPHPPSNYGSMVWNASSSKLCVVLRGSAHVYCAEKMTRFFRPVYAKFTCGVWSPDSTQLLLSTDSALVLYSVTNLETQLLELVHVLNIPGVIAAITPSPNLYLCARELPLHDLIQKSSTDVLSCYLNDTDSVAAHLFGELIPTSSPTSSSCIVLVSGQGVVLSTMSLQGMLTPNLLCWSGEKSWCVVGSSMARSFQVVAVSDGIMEKRHQISIPTNQRAKGITVTNSNSNKMFTAVADVFPGDNQLFPQSLRETAWTLTISSLSLATATDRLPGKSGVSYAPLSMDVGIEKLTIPSRPTPQKKASGDFQLPARGFSSSTVEPSSSSFLPVDPVIHKLTENLKQQLERQESKGQYVQSKNITSISRYPRHKKETSESRQVVPVERKSFTPCIKRGGVIQEVADHRIDVYESLNDIATVDVICLYVDAHGSKLSEKMKRFLLTTGGLLSVELLTRVFEVEEIEIKTGNTYAAFTATEDGYVPIKFRHGEKFMIRGIICDA